MAGTVSEAAGPDWPGTGTDSVGLAPLGTDSDGPPGLPGVDWLPLGRLVKVAVHLVQTVEVEVRVTVEMVWVVITVLEDPELTVLVTGHSVVVT